MNLTTKYMSAILNKHFRFLIRHDDVITRINVAFYMISIDPFPDPFLSGLGRAAEQVQKGVIPNKARGEELATQQFNAAKKEQVLEP